MSANGNFFVDLASQCTPLSNLTNPATLVQLSVGGDAILSIPSEYLLDGKVFTVKTGAILNIESGYNIFGDFSFGDTAGSNNINSYSYNPGGPAGTSNLSIYAICYWNSTLDILSGFSTINVSTSNTINTSSFSFSCSSLSDIQFVISAGTGNSGANTCSLSLTQFSIEF